MVARIQSEVTKVLSSPELKASLATHSAETAPGTPAELAGLVKEEPVRWAKIVTDSGRNSTEAALNTRARTAISYFTLDGTYTEDPR